MDRYTNDHLGELLKHGKQIIIKGWDYVNNPENKFTITVLGGRHGIGAGQDHERTTRGRLHRLEAASAQALIERATALRAMALLRTEHR